MTPEVSELKKVLDGITSGVKNVVAQCIAAGKILSQLKAKSKDGDWKLILESVELSWHSADRYMALWEHRSELNLKEVKSLSDAYKIVSAVSFKIGKPADTDKPKSTTYKAKTSEQPASNTDRQPITADTENSRFYMSPPPTQKTESGECEVLEPRDIHTSKQDTETAMEFAGYPKEIRVTVKNAQEELEVRNLIKRLGDGEKKSTVRDVIASLVRTYKEITGKKLVVTGADAGQIRRLVKLNGEDCSSEIIEVFGKACKANGFFARQSHQISTFVKHYGNIRNEIENGSSPERNQIRETITVKSI